MLKKNIIDTITSTAKDQDVHPILLLARPEFRQQCVSNRWRAFLESDLPLLKHEKEIEGQTPSIIEGTISHNTKGISNSIGSLAMLERSSLLFRPLMAIDCIYDYRRISVLDGIRILLIGCRTEYEVLLSLSYGFKEGNIYAIDLISYSEYITVGDMHKLPFPDNFFNIVVCGWTLGYSVNPADALREMLRVTKNEGHISLGQDVYSQDYSSHQFISAGRPSSIDELLRLFPIRDGCNVLPIYSHNPSYPEGKIQGFLGHLLLTAQIQKDKAIAIF